MSDEQTPVTTEVKEVVSEPAKDVVEDATNRIAVNEELINKLFKTLEDQNKYFESLKEINDQQSKKITELEDKIKDVDSTLKENINEVIGGYDYDEQIQNMTNEQKDTIIEDARKSFDRFKEIFKS